MEENILEVPPNFKLYTDRSILIATFFGGPLTAGYLIADNYRHLGEKKKFRNTWICTILASFLIFGIAL